MTPTTRSSPVRRTLAALLPLGACGLQWACWPFISPFVWFLFYPTVFLSSWLGGLWAGLASTLLSTGLVWWFFMPPVHVLLKPAPATFLNAALFMVMGALFSGFHHRFQAATRKLVLAQEAERQAMARLAEAELREREKLLDMTSRLAKVGGWAFDARTFEASWTEEVARIHDLDPGTQPTVEMGLAYYHERSRPVIAEAVRLALDEGLPYDLELELVSAAGRAKWVRTQGRPVLEGGAVVKVEGALQDITDRKLMELALRDSEARYRSLFEQAGVGVVEVDPATGRLLRANGRFCESLGYTLEEILGLTYQDLTHPDERGRDEDEVRRVAAGEQDGYTVEKRYLHKGGGIIWCALTVRPLRTEGAQVPHLVSIVEDITARKRAEEEIRRLNATLERRVAQRTQELKAANQELESFAYAVSHDLRAPLRAMGGFSQALQEDCGEALPEEGRGYLDQISLASARMAALIDGLLALSRTTRGELARVPVDLSALAEAELQEHARQEPERAVQWRVAPGIRALGDPAMLGAVLANLVGNAWKYTAHTPGARIEVDAVQEEGRTWMRIADNGCGFDMAHAGKLFQPFQRLHRQDEFPGLGIGLATAQRIVRRHGGTLKAAGSPGQGATFLINLPVPEAS